MSGFVGIWNLDGRPVDRLLLERMTETMAHRGPDGTGYWIHGPAGLGHQMLHTTPESVREKQPLKNESGMCCLALDGRIDNRSDLATQLASKGIQLGTDTDAELVLKAYECWGSDCPTHLLGDFAFVLWDGRRQQVFCARDVIGSKPFYFYRSGRVFLCASEIQPFFLHPDIGRSLNEGMLGEFLAGEIMSQEETLYRELFRLPPAHSLLITRSRLQKVRYWSADPQRSLSYKSDQDYADHFLEVFRESVRCRLRSHAPVGSYLSGGLDSSSVVGMTQSLYAGGQAADHGFETFSLIFPGLACDEQPFIDAVTDRWGVPSNRIRPEAQTRAVWAEWARQDQDFPGYPNGRMGDPLRALAQRKGFRVLLTGGGGDEWLTGSTFHAADLLRRGWILAFLRRIGRDSGYTGVGDMARAVLRFGIAPLLPYGLHRRIKRLVKGDGVPAWIDRNFAGRIRLADRLAKPRAALQFSTCAQQETYDTLLGGWWAHGFEVEERAAARFGLEERHPLADRRLIEFALALPEEQCWRGAIPKFILRHATQGLLPERVRQRVTKAEFSTVFTETFEVLDAGALLDSSVCISNGWVNRAAVREMCRHVEQHFEGDTGDWFRYLWPLWMVVALEIWHRAVLAESTVRPEPARHGSDPAPPLVSSGQRRA